MGFIGKGAYGQVYSVGGYAVKKFNKLSHLIQEYTALSYLNDTRYIVKTAGVDFDTLELKMELYDSSFRTWLSEGNRKSNDKHKILKCVLRGLIELHDRNLCHTDLKPGNILIRKNPFKVVIGDCGFVSISRYAKVDRTAPRYREQNVKRDRYHDIFSFGIMLMEITSGVILNRLVDYNQLKQIINNKLMDSPYKNIILSCIQEDRERRPTARKLLKVLYNEDYLRWVPPDIKVDPGKFDDLRKYMKNISEDHHINRRLIGFTALCDFLSHNNVHKRQYRIYGAVTLLILSAIFGNGLFNDALVSTKYNGGRSVNPIVKQLLSNHKFVQLLFIPYTF